MTTYLFTGSGQPPPQLHDWRLCQMYHCLPSELDGQDWLRMRDHALVREVEAQVAAQVKQEQSGGR